MNQRMIFPIVLGLVGCAVLIALGIWQMQRLQWKEGVLAQIGERISATPVALPMALTEAADEYRTVNVSGNLLEEPIHVLTSQKPEGPGFRVIQPLMLATGQRLLVDLGFIPESEKTVQAFVGDVSVTGSLLWPDEVDSFTPAPNLQKNIWFARDLTAMADALGTAPILIVASESFPTLAPRLTPVTIDIPNDHFGYAVTWFSLAAVWGMMTGYALWRIKRRID
jgi:surfeit locus 1 family protein